MKVKYQGITMWYGTPDAPAPSGFIQAGAETTITVGVQPADASNHIEVRYRINQRSTETIAAWWLWNDSSGKIQYFKVRLPPFRVGDVVEYTAICYCAGRQVPSPEEAKQFASSFRVIGAETKQTQGRPSGSPARLLGSSPSIHKKEAPMAKSCEQLRTELRILKNPHAPPSEKKDEEIDAIEQQLKDQNCAAPTDLTGYWRADDGGFYYLMQDSETLWWVGLSSDPDPELNSDFGLQNGLTFSNVFRGQRIGNTIEGMWSDVPRGETTNHGRLSLEITTADNGITAQLQKTDFSGGFGGSLWSLEVPGWSSTADRSIQDVFNAVKRGGGDEEPLLEELQPWKDHVVLFGTAFLNINPSNGVVHVNAPGVGASYAAFIPDRSPGDGDLFLSIQIDRAQLERQNDLANFWTDGWESGRNPDNIRNKLDQLADDRDYFDIIGHLPGAQDKLFDFLHLELVMFARTAEDGDVDHYNDPPLLPGWQEENGNSVLLNGRPINGNVVTAIGSTDGPVEFIRDKQITEGTRIRVTGPLNLDCGHGVNDPCYEEYGGYHNQEIHPVYALDIIDETPSDDLSGTWADDLGRTYYVRQLDDNTLWWLGMSPFRDNSFARVFQGTINRQDQTITGQWADVPLGQGQSSGSLTLQIDPGMLTLLPFEEGFQEPPWTKLYHVPPPPPPPPPGVFINGETEIKVDLIDVKADPPTVTYFYTIAPVSLQGRLTVVWSSKSRHVQFADHTAQSTDITFDLTGLTKVGNRRTVQVDVSVTDALGTQVKDSVSVTIIVTPTT